MPKRSQGIALLYGFSDARLEALTPALHERGFLLVRANEVDSAVVLLNQVRVRVVVLASESDRRSIARVASQKKVRVVVDPLLEPSQAVDAIFAQLEAP